jgi:hypothetical protein
MSTRVDYHDRTAWLDGRAELGSTRIGASEVACVLGVSPYGSPWSVWARRHGVEAKQTAAMQAGNDFESLVVDWFLRERGALEVVARGLSIWHDDVLAVTPDCAYIDAEGRLAVLEVKCPHRAGHGAWTWQDGATVTPGWWDTPAEDLGAPGWYIAQVQAQLALTGAEYADLVGFFGPHDVHVIRIEPDPAWWASTRATLDAWRRRHLLGEVDWTESSEPDPDGSDECLRLALQRCTRPQRDATEAEAELLASALAVSAAREAANARHGEARRALTDAMIAGGGPRRIVCPVGSAHIDKRGVLHVRAARD